ncbi:MAG TPA: biopolymer transporter ExbD, partial [Verrucomicrobiota bacterium]|nr:biopolymer transporter ExbD [Verrucomicrobiota bacterium]
MNNQGSIRPFHGRLDFAPFVGVLFLMLPLLLFHTSMVFKPGIEVDITLPESSQHTGVNDPSLAVAVDANGILYFRNRQIPGLARSITVKKTDEGMPLVDLV